MRTIPKNRPDYAPNDDIWTPEWIFEQLKVTFDLDVASSPLTTNVPAKNKLTEKGLEAEWFGKIWMNPPYSKVTPWIEKWRKHGNGLGIVPIAKAQWFFDLWHDEKVKIGILNHHIKFIRPNGEKHGIFMPTGIISIGEENHQALARLENIWIR